MSDHTLVPSSELLTTTAFFPACLPWRRMTTLPYLMLEGEGVSDWPERENLTILPFEVCLFELLKYIRIRK